MIKKIDLKTLPEYPGVYIMKNLENKIIYIGKAKNIKNRVSSYFQNPKSSLKTFELVKNINDIEFFLCNNELEALILENNLIKEHKPKYNILLKDNKTYPYLKITNDDMPKINIVRSKIHLEEDEKSMYFGPYPNGLSIMLKELLFAFELNNLNIDLYNKKILGKNLRYNNYNDTIKFVNKEDEERYKENYKNLIDFLKYNSNNVIDSLYEKMENYSENLDYENALKIRNRIEALNKLKANQIIEYSKDIDEDIFYIQNTNTDNIYICVLSVRDGNVIDKNIFTIENLLQEDDVFNRIFLSYYNNKKIPKNIIIQKKYKKDINILKKWFKLEKNKNVEFYAPIIKSRRLELLELASKNLNHFIEERFKTEKSLLKGLIDLKNILNLKKIPNLIECFDISNIQGKDAVSAMSVTYKGKAANNRYRHYKITCKDTPDDFLMMKETIFRRYSKLDKDKLPDLILIDGGKGQLGAAIEILENLDVIKYVDVISIAKREEEIFKAYESKSYIIDKNEEALKILIRARDEVHRFGITYHRKLRSKRNIKSKLDEIKGIGPKRKKELIKKFGNVKNIFEAEERELLKILPLNIVKEIIYNR